MKQWKPSTEVYQRLGKLEPNALATIKMPRQHTTALAAPGFIHPKGQVWLAEGRLGEPHSFTVTPEDIIKELEQRGVNGITLSCDMTLAVFADRKMIWAHTRLTGDPMVACRFEGANYSIKALLDRHHTDTRALVALMRKDLQSKPKAFSNWEFKKLGLTEEAE